MSITKHCLLGCIYLLLSCNPLYASNNSPSTAFYYATQPPVDLLGAYQRVVVEPGNISSTELSALIKNGATVYAYLSVGEVASSRPWAKDIKDVWKAGENKAWNSIVLDLTHDGWHQYLLQQRMRHLWEQGYRGFFLDTMDSYQLFAKTVEERTQQESGLAQLIQAMVDQYPGVSLLYNRGFEVLDKIAHLGDGLVAESLYAGWNPEKSEYRPVPDNDREWLTNKLLDVQQRFKLPVTVIDYLPPTRREEAESIAKQISADGFTPWVSTPQLNYMGVGALHLLPRKVLYLYDSSDGGGTLPYTEIHRFLAMPLEYQGYIPDYLDISQNLPEYALKSRYAGIALWLNREQHQNIRLKNWLLKQIHDQVPVAFFNLFPFPHDSEIKQALGIEIESKSLQFPVSLNSLSDHIGFEFAPQPRTESVPVIHSPKNAQPWLKLMDTHQQFSEPVFTANWGGMALFPYLVQTLPTRNEDQSEQYKWTIDPFQFLSKALKLKPLPAPDTSTENGRRILTVHIDGDGFYSHSQVHLGDYNAQVIMDDFLKPYKLPHTVSIIEGEIAATGIKPELSPELEDIARQIFRLPNVEIASHTFSHPFDWAQAAAQSKAPAPQSQDHDSGSVFKAKDGHYHMAIPGYSYNSEREIAGSVNYINNQLAPKDKKTKVLLWSGNCLPNEEDLAWTVRMGITNMNGGDTIIRRGLDSLTNVAPSGIVQGRYFQPFAPIQNENVYTNDWLGPYHGFQRVIETFSMTDTPRRLKPISIYYHFYSGEKVAAAKALKRVYDWAVKQNPLPMWISEYTPRLFAARHAVYEQLPDNGWRIHGASELSTLRLPEQSPPPNIQQSKGIAGFRELQQGTYVALNGDDTVDLYINKQANTRPYLHNANARLLQWQPKGQQIQFQFKGHSPVELVIATHKRSRCRVQTEKKQAIKRQHQGKLWRFNFEHNDTGKATLHCA